MDDLELLESLRRDRAGGIETLLRQYTPLLRYVIGGILPDHQDAQDCLSEVSLRLWQNIDRFDPARGSLSAWLTAVARNTALNHRKARQQRESRLAKDSEPVDPGTPEQALLRQEQSRQLTDAIARLRPRDRQLLYRKYYYLQPTSQIAAELGLSDRAVEGRLYRLRLRLRQELGGDNS